MNFSRGKAYKIVEFDHGMVIIDADDALNRPGMQELVIADSVTLVEYLGRYFYERERGKSLKNAHESALHGVHIVNIQKPPRQ